MSLQIVPSNIYLYATNTNEVIVGTENVTWNAPVEANILSAGPTGFFNLVANHTYKLEAYLTLYDVAGTYNVFWSNPIGGVLPNSPFIFGDSDQHVVVTSIYRPEEDELVSVRLDVTGTVTVLTNSLVSIIAIN